MVRPTGPTNPYLKQLIRELKEKALKNDARIWRRVANLLEKPRRKQIGVNLSKIERYSRAGETILVPGVVLGSGELTKPLKIAAWRFSARAKEKILKVGGRVMEIKELIKENPKGSNIKLMV